MFRKPKRRADNQITPSSILHVAGLGLKLGHSQIEAYEILNKLLTKSQLTDIELELLDVHMIEDASYCFVEFKSIAEGVRTLETLNKYEFVDCGGKRRVLSVTYAERCQPKQSPQDILVCTSKYSSTLPDGLSLKEEFITPEEEITLMNEIESGQWNCKLARRTQQYGYSFNYGIRGIDFEEKAPPIPDNIQRIVIDRLVAKGIFLPHETPNQVTVNEYEPGQGIAAHIDTHSAFHHCIMSLTLNSGTVMDFKWPCPEMVGTRSSNIRRAELLPWSSNESAAISIEDEVPVVAEVDNEMERKRHLQYLSPRSLLLMNGESRYEWTHAIAPRKMDKVNGQIIPRERRLSLTLRRVLFDGETCGCVVPFCVASRNI